MRDLNAPRTSRASLCLFGTADLVDPAGRPLNAVLRQPKRLALLAYVALAGERQFRRRDSMLAMFWPESDTARGRAALRKSLSFLRKHLGEDVFLTRADDVAVDRDVLWCDAVAFQTVTDEGGGEERLRLYRGGLLDGFFIGSAPGFERWLEDERGRLRSMAAGAAREVVRVSSAAGDHGSAVAAAQRLVEIVPEDEDALRVLLEVLEASGDRAAALKAYERFAKRLFEDLELAPTPETLAVIERIRHHEPRAGARQVERGTVATNPNLIAVLPFDVRGDTEYSYLREGLVDLLSAKLSGAGDVRTVDPLGLLGYLRASGYEEVDLEVARRAAAHYGAGTFVLGSLIATPQRWQLRAIIYDLVRDRETPAHVESNSDDGVFEIVDEFTRHLLATRSESVGGHLGRLGAMTSDSMDAVRAYLAGERAFRAGRVSDAADAYAKAVGHDDRFVLALYRLGLAESARGRHDDALAASGGAHALQARATPHVRGLIAAQQHWLKGEVAQAEKTYARVLADWPDDVESWFHLGHLQVAYNGYRGRTIAEARSALARALELDPTHVGTLEDLAHISLTERRDEEATDYASRVVRAEPSHDRALRARALMALVTAPDELRDLGRTIGTSRPQSIAATVGSVFARAAAAEATDFAAGIAGTAPSAAVGALMHVLLASLALERGDRADYQQWMARGYERDRTSSTEHEALIASIAQEHFSPDAVAEVQKRVSAIDVASSSPGGAWPPPAHRAVRSQIRLYLEGLCAVRLGDVERAGALADECTAMTSKAVPEMPANFAAGLRAAAAYARGMPEEALRHLDGIRVGGWFLAAPASPFLALTRERWLRGNVLRDLGRTEEAEGYLGTLGEISAFERVARWETVDR